MGEILSAEGLEPARQFVGFVKRNGGTQGAQRNSAADLIERLLDSHEALRARLAEVKAERDAAERAFTAQTDSVGNWQRRAEAAEARLAEAEAMHAETFRIGVEAQRRLAEVEQALRDGQRLLRETYSIKGDFAYAASLWLIEVDQIIAVLDKGEPR